MKITYTDILSGVEANQIAALYESVGFGDACDYAGEDLISKIFGPGVFGFFAFDVARLVGMARILSDDFVTSWIAEVCVAPEHQRQGIGSTLLKMVNSRFAHTALYAEAFAHTVRLLEQAGITSKSKLVACSRAYIAPVQG